MKRLLILTVALLILSCVFAQSKDNAIYEIGKVDELRDVRNVCFVVATCTSGHRCHRSGDLREAEVEAQIIDGIQEKIPSIKKTRNIDAADVVVLYYNNFDGPGRSCAAVTKIDGGNYSGETTYYRLLFTWGGGSSNPFDAALKPATGQFAKEFVKNWTKANIPPPMEDFTTFTANRKATQEQAPVLTFLEKKKEEGITTQSSNDSESDLFLSVDQVLRISNIFEIVGRTNPGATVVINEEPVPLVSADGSFKHFTSPFPHKGKNIITIRAQDRRGNSKTLKREVYTD